MKRGENPKSLKNLEKGRTKGKGRPERTGGPSWKDLITAYGELDAPKEYADALKMDARTLRRMGLKSPSWKLVVVAMAFREAMKGNAAILRELLERSEGKVKDQIEHSGEVQSTLVFTPDVVARMFERRPGGGNSASSANQGDDGGAQVG